MVGAFFNSVKNHSFELFKLRNLNMHKTLFLIILQLSAFQLFSQTIPDFQAPLKIPMYLSGNFGEIRSDHFHSGIDIKTQGSIGHHVFAIEAGYVSRIKVQANGYGKSIYIAHPNGFTSVYGHLDRYNGKVAAYVKAKQYERRAHQVDLYLKAGEIPVGKGEFIAYSGNSGSSMGPHLHFEVRTSANQHPTNVLNYGFNVIDEIAPRFKKLVLYPLDKDSRVNGSDKKQSFDLVIDKGIYMVPWGTKIEVYGSIGVGVEVYDYLNGASNRCGIYTLEGSLDGKVFYSHIMEEFAFSETRYVNAFIDYEEKVNSRQTIQRLYRLPNDKLRIYRELQNNGMLEMKEAGSRSIQVKANDVAGNISTLSFQFEVKERQNNTGIDTADDTLKQASRRMLYNEASSFENEKVSIKIPALALFENIDFTYAESESKDGMLSDFYHIHTPGTPLLKPYTLSVSAPIVAPELRDKLVFVSFDSKEQKYVSAGGKYSNGSLSASLRNFGEYAIHLDTIAPEILPFKGEAKGNLSGRKSIQFTIRDELSEIEKYEAYIDNRWALFEYDPKNERLTYIFDGDKIQKNTEHELELYVSDSQGNVNLYHSTFTW